MHAVWRRSSFSQPTQANCVEVAYSTSVSVRDSKNPDGGTLRLPESSWSPRRLAHLVG
ncbi:DUF397 domain-containing protein [Actinokineospora sp. HUAS TT18]|uniref:DUF397 domain-containing protein n=1 Tax=Actinokineospora sp. HUAS TT18 TaxID=3447451 RepID=UPI003F527EAC